MLTLRQSIIGTLPTSAAAAVKQIHDLRQIYRVFFFLGPRVVVVWAPYT